MFTTEMMGRQDVAKRRLRIVRSSTSGGDIRLHRKGNMNPEDVGGLQSEGEDNPKLTHSILLNPQSIFFRGVFWRFP